MKNQEKLEKVRELVEPTCKKLKCWGHGWQHTLNVVKWAKKIAEGEGADSFLCQVAAYCHDLGRLEEERRKIVNFTAGAPGVHGALSVKPTERILDVIGIMGKDRDDILKAVKNHVIRKYEGPNRILSILQDADRADGFSKFAVLRFAAFNCQMPIPEPKNESEIDSFFEKARLDLKNDPDRKAKMLHTLDYVFGWYDTLLNTESARVYLSDGYKFLKKFYEEIKT